MKLWIARDEDGSLYLFKDKPHIEDDGEGQFWCSVEDSMRLNVRAYPEVTFENSPMEVELVLKK